jgi:enamine deaminase RidA (YjgF/YER057c/UK114 family)
MNGWGSACQVGDRLLVSSIGPTEPGQADGTCDPDPHQQYLRCFETLAQTLTAAGFGPRQIVRSNMWLRDPGDATTTVTGRDAVLNEVQPATSQLCVARLSGPAWRVQIDAEANTSAHRQKIQPTYPSRSQGLRVGNRVLVSCLAPIWWDGPRPYCDPDPIAQARRCWENIVEVLEEGGAAAEHLISIRFYIRHPADVPVMARFARETLAAFAPAVSIVPLGGYMRPEWRVEVEADAVI